MKKSLKFAVLFFVIIIMIAAVAKRKNKLKKVTPYGLRPVAVRVAEVRQGLVENTHSYLGTIKSWQTAQISSRISARVDEVLCREGDVVKQGDILIRLDDKDLQAQIKVADAQIAAMESTIKSLETNKKFWEAEDRRDSQLAQDGVISTVAAATTHNRMSDAVSKFMAAKANLESLRSSRVNITVKQSYTKLAAPFDGQVSVRNVDAGDLASPGKPLIVLEDRSALKIEFNAPQADVDHLKRGMRVKAAVDGKNETWEISRVHPALNQARMITAEIKVEPSESLKSGAFIPLNAIWRKSENAVTVPDECIMTRASGDKAVFTEKDGILKLTPVKTVISNSGRTEVEGLTPGDKVVTSTFLGWANLADGLKVEVAK